MDSHGVGRRRGVRQAGIPKVHTFPITYANRVSGTDYLLGKFEADTDDPARLRIIGVIETADNAVTSSVLRLGTAAGGTQILNDVNLKAAAQTNYTDAGGLVRIINDTFELWARVTRVGATTAGRAWVIVEESGLDVTTEPQPE
jgi:hypothetical protein